MSRDGIRPDLRHFPLLGEAGRAMLDRLCNHPAAPIFRNRSGNRLIAEDLPLVQAHATEVLSARLGWDSSDGLPDWLQDFVREAYQRVPGYRARGVLPELSWDSFAAIPTISRADLSRDITRSSCPRTRVCRQAIWLFTGVRWRSSASNCRLGVGTSAWCWQAFSGTVSPMCR
jgi:phenylacetate-CoA ligase